MSFVHNRKRTVKMRYSIIPLVAIAGILFHAAGLYAGEFGNPICFQGYTGILNTPNAEITEEGVIYPTFSNQLEAGRRHLNSAENYMFSLGLLPFLEIGGRLTEEHPSLPDGGMRDLSGNFKVQFPRFWDNKYIPNLAFGMQDMGGGSSFFRTRYAVVSETIDPVRISVGYGAGPDRMEGVFGGAELKIFDWFRLLGDYDTKETNVGIHLSTPEDLFGIPFGAGLSAKTSLDHDAGDFDLAVMLKIPLGFGKSGREEASGVEPPDGGIGDEKTLPPDEKPAPMPPDEDIDTRLLELKEKLAGLGFENVRTGIRSAADLYVEYENNRYNHNELDGVGVVMGVAAGMAPPGTESLVLVLKEIEIPMVELRAPVRVCNSFMENRISERNFSEHLGITALPWTAGEDVRFAGGKRNSGRFRVRAALYPGIRTFVGTELGVFDALVSIRPDVRMHLWKGTVVGAVWDLPIFWTDNFKDGQGLSWYRNDSQLDRLMLHQAFKITPDIMNLTSIGMLFKDNNGVLNETMWSPGRGNHRLRLKLGKFEDEEDIEKEIWLASYRYLYADMDLAFEVTYGKFWYQDEGWILKMRRYFDDTGITVFYRHTGTDTGERAAGIAFSFPFTPRRDMKPGHVQLKGIDRWTYEQQTTIAKSGERNPLNPGLAVVPNTAHSLERSFYNHDRLSEIYIRKHLARMRRAFEKWGE